MAEATIYEILGIPEERAGEIARAVRLAFSGSKGPREWVKRLIEDFDIGPDEAQAFACGWFAGRYERVSDVFSAVRKEMDRADKEKGDEGYPPVDGYA